MLFLCVLNVVHICCSSLFSDFIASIVASIGVVACWFSDVVLYCIEARAFGVALRINLNTPRSSLRRSRVDTNKRRKTN